MEIIRLPKSATLAQLTIERSYSERVRSIFQSTGTNSSFAEQRDFDTVEEAEEAAAASARQRNATYLIIKDLT